ncbi:hypothetical protein GCM10008018_17990 [Paenibacillus marchantiophytorum]|uniref:PpiC domain-containing protein n=1 Tax=Paenibacillus marchantiophytorum TaxID=1619310 RepID=A0ABQ2BUF7_9BACL|nr:peptidylprolyl isomerase [Paenibacillus marchantiophytorum]GGI46617.1 hypothetical protein GCM10008018_17990 [Paenibacillus marchantiophytorum]
MKSRWLRFILAICLGVATLVMAGLLLASGSAEEEGITHYQGGTITRTEHSTYLSIMQFYTPGISQKLNQDKFQQSALREHVASNILAARGRAITQDSQQALAEQQWNEFKKSYSDSFSYSGVSVEERLRDLALTEREMISYIEDQIYGRSYFKSKVTEEALQKDYQLNEAEHNFDTYDIRQIYLSFTANGSKIADKSETLLHANEIVRQWKAGADFTDLAKRYSDDPSVAQNGGFYQQSPIYTLDSDIKDEIVRLDLHTVSEPLLAESGYYMVQVEGKHTQSYEEARESLRDSYVQKAYTAFMTDELPKFFSLN